MKGRVLMTTINTNEIATTLLTFYLSREFTDNYIFGYIYKKELYFTFDEGATLAEITKTETASENGGKCLRIRLNNKKREALMQKNSTHLCNYDEFMEIYRNCKYNRGEVFEKLITEFFGQIWKKDNIKFDKAGDIVIDNKSYQIKFEGANILDEKTMKRMEVE